MLRLRHFCMLCTFAAATSVMVGLPAQAVDEPANLIKYRQSIMTSFGGHISAIASVAKGEVSFTDEVAGHARAINEMANNLVRLFPEGSGKEAGETRALPAIWEKRSEFEAVIKVLQDESAKLAEVAEGGDVAAIGQQLGALGKNACGACHGNFREKQS